MASKVERSLAASKEVYPYPSRFGSHSSMIDAEATEKLGDPKRVVLRDEFGLYETDRKSLDNREADVNRHSCGARGIQSINGTLVPPNVTVPCQTNKPATLAANQDERYVQSEPNNGLEWAK